MEVCAFCWETPNPLEAGEEEEGGVWEEGGLVGGGRLRGPSGIASKGFSRQGREEAAPRAGGEICVHTPCLIQDMRPEHKAPLQLSERRASSRTGKSAQTLSGLFFKDRQLSVSSGRHAQH